MNVQPYTKKQKSEIEKVRAAFQDYIQNSGYIDLLWSDKVGYVLLPLNPESEDGFRVESEPERIENAEMLCERLFTEIFYDVINFSGKGHDTDKADAEGRAEVQRRLRPYIEQFPEYKSLAEPLYE